MKHEPRNRHSIQSGNCSSGFTLIELLVVISIIALLIGLLLPALSRAREHSQKIVCLSNQRQLAIAFFAYAADEKVFPGAYWQGGINLDWSGKNNRIYNKNKHKHPLETSVLKPYLSTNFILECPKARRDANTFFDYTMVIRLAGAQTDLRWTMVYPEEPAKGTSSKMVRFQAIPFLVEEDAKWWNKQYDDGSFANGDQFTERHDGAANVAYLDGSASLFASPKGADPLKQESGDLTTNHLRLQVGQKEYGVGSSNSSEFGWANHPD